MSEPRGGNAADGPGAREADAELEAERNAYYPGAAGQPHPGPSSITLPAVLRDAIVEHARRDVPNEACGIVVGSGYAADGGLPVRWVPLRNMVLSAFRYAIDPSDLLRLTIETDDADEVFWAIVHSHVSSPARPSPTDLRESHYPDSLYLLVSLDPREADPTTGSPSVRAWRIVGGGVHEVPLTIDG